MLATLVSVDAWRWNKSLFGLEIRVSLYLPLDKRKIRIWTERKIMDDQDFRGLVTTCNTAAINTFESFECRIV